MNQSSQAAARNFLLGLSAKLLIPSLPSEPDRSSTADERSYPRSIQAVSGKTCSKWSCPAATQMAWEDTNLSLVISVVENGVVPCWIPDPEKKVINNFGQDGGKLLTFGEYLSLHLPNHDVWWLVDSQ